MMNIDLGSAPAPSRASAMPQGPSRPSPDPSLERGDPFGQLVGDLSEDRGTAEQRVSAQPRRQPAQPRPAVHAARTDDTREDPGVAGAGNGAEHAAVHPHDRSGMKDGDDPRHDGSRKGAPDELLQDPPVMVALTLPTVSLAPASPGEGSQAGSDAVATGRADAGTQASQDLPSTVDGAGTEMSAALGRARGEAAAPVAVGPAAADAAAAQRAQHGARQIALAAVKAALAAQSPGTAGVSAQTHETTMPSVDKAAGAVAPGPPIGEDKETASGKPMKPAPSAPLSGPQVMELGAGGETASDNGQGSGPRKRDQAVSIDAPAPARAAAHPAQAIAAFQAAALAGIEAASDAPASVQAAPSTSDPLLDAELPASIIHNIHLQAARGGGEARISLNPGFLGAMTVGVQVDGAAVVASLHASNPDVRDWLRTNEAGLRQALAEQGFNLERLVILDEEPAESAGGQSRGQQDDTEQRPRRQPRPVSQGSFEALI